MIIAIAAGIVPMIIYPVFLYWMDRYEKEPLKLLFAAFLWGFIPAAAISLVAQLIFSLPMMLLDPTGAAADEVTTVFVAPVTEEFSKGIAVLLIFLIWRMEFDGVFDGIIYGSIVGFGFASMENILYFSSFGVNLFLARAVLFGLNHALYTSMTGVGFGMARYSSKPFLKVFYPIGGLALAITFHTIHNLSLILTDASPVFLCFTFAAAWGGVFFVLVIMLLAIRKERDRLIDFLRDEVSAGTLSERVYQIVTSPTRRIAVQINTLISDGLPGLIQLNRYFERLTDLAYRKYGAAKAEDKLGENELAELRTRALSAGYNGLEG